MKNDFKKFTFEQFGKEIYFKKSDKADTFESLFGDGFVNEDEEYSRELEHQNFVSFCGFLKSRNGRNVLAMLDAEEKHDFN